MVSRRLSASASMSKFSMSFLIDSRPWRSSKYFAVAVLQLAVEHLVHDQLLGSELGERRPDLVEAIQLALGPVAELAHLALATVAHLAANVGLGAFLLQLGEIVLELLRTLGESRSRWSSTAFFSTTISASSVDSSL